MRSADRRTPTGDLHSFKVLDSAPYNDPYVELQHNMRTLSVSGAHRWASGRSVRVGIIDTGVDLRHRELGGKVVATATAHARRFSPRVSMT